MTKKVYIAHPFRGKKPYTAEQIQKNTLHVTGICRAIFRDMTDVVPVSPVHAFGFADPFEDDQHNVLDCCGELLHACDEMWVFGDWLSSMGCIFEVGTFCRRDEGGIAFCSFDEETKRIKKAAAFDLAIDKSDVIAYILGQRQRAFGGEREK